MCASSAPQGAGTCDVEGCGGRVEVEEMVYVCTDHNQYACMGCVPRAARLTVDALLDECVMVEQELGLKVVDSVTAAEGEDGYGLEEGGMMRSDEAPQALHHAVLLGDGELSAGPDDREVVVDGRGRIGNGDMDNVGGQGWVVSAEQLRKKGLAAASWVGGRRRAARKEVELGGRERRWQEKDHQRLRMQKREWGDDIVGDHGDRSLRARTGEAVVGDLAPQAPSHAEGDGEEKTSVKRKRQTEKRKSGPKAAEDVIEKEERQPQLSLDSCESSDNCGSKRRRVLDKKEDYHIEKTKKKAGENTMKERLEGDEGIE